MWAVFKECRPGAFEGLASNEEGFACFVEALREVAPAGELRALCCPFIDLQALAKHADSSGGRVLQQGTLFDAERVPVDAADAQQVRAYVKEAPAMRVLQPLAACALG